MTPQVYHRFFTVLAITLVVACSSNNPSNPAVDAGATPDASPPDASLEICMAEPTPIPPLPTPSEVPAGTVCSTDDDCIGVGGFCRALAASGMECTAYSAVDDACGGLAAPPEVTRCTPGLECDAPNDETSGTCVCTPNCDGRVCGTDGCGGTCGSCDEVCAAEGSLCNDFVGDECCSPIEVTSLPFERIGRTEGAEDTFDMPTSDGNLDPLPDEIIRFEPSESGNYLTWGECHDAAVFTSCGGDTTPLVGIQCFALGEGEEWYSQVSLEAGQEYFFAEQPLPPPRGTNPYVRRINGPMKVIADSAPAVTDIALDSTHVYWASGTNVNRRLRDGSGATQVVMVAPGNVSEIKVAGTQVFAIDRLGGRLLTAPVTGGAPEILASNQEGVGKMSVGPNHLYWTIRGNPTVAGCDPDFPPPLNGAVRRVLLAGGAVEVVASGQEIVTDVVTDGTHVYWSLRRGLLTETNCLAGPGIRRQLHTGGAIETFAATRAHEHLVMAGTDLYAAAEEDRAVDSLSEMTTWYRIDKATLATSKEFLEIHMAGEAAVSGTSLYVTSSNSMGDTRPAFAGGVLKLDDTSNDVDLDDGIGVAPALNYEIPQFAVDGGFVYLNWNDRIIALPAVPEA